MKVNIWIHKKDVIDNKIKDYHLTRPIIDRHDEWVQVTITQDEFAQLEDNKAEARMNIIGQNGNDGIHYDHDQDEQPFAD